MRWMWIDRIIEFEANTRLVTVKTVSPNENYLVDQFPDDAHSAPVAVYPASLMIEGMAQTAGILVGSVNRFRENVVLAKVVVAQFDCEVRGVVTLSDALHNQEDVPILTQRVSLMVARRR